jgi:hypothetical protein
MVRRMILFLTLVAASVPAPAHAIETCVVSPDPVVKPGDFTITAFNAEPGALYWVRTDFAKQSFGHHADGAEYADANGIVVFPMNTDSVPNNIIPIGTVRARVFADEGGRSTFARCTFEVV